MKFRRLLLAALAALAPALAAAQTAGTLNLNGPTTGGTAPITPAVVNAAVNAQLATKQDVGGDVSGQHVTINGTSYVLGTWLASVPSGSVPSCNTPSSALSYTPGTGFGCNIGINASQLNGASFAAPGAIGGTTPSSGVFTTLTATTKLNVSTTGGIVGTTAGDSANSGSVGELLTSSQVGQTITSNNRFNATQVALTAGDWDVTGCVYLSVASGGSFSQIVAAINTTSLTLPAYPGSDIVLLQLPSQAGPSSSEICSPVVRENLTGTTTVYLVGQSVLTGTVTANGYIRARRVR